MSPPSERPRGGWARARRAVAAATALAGAGQWRQLGWRIGNRLRGVDLSVVDLDDLSLSADIARRYSNSGGPELERILRQLPIGSDDRVVDLGCGKGGALLTLARLPFGRVAGVDISPDLLAVAAANLRRRRVRDVDLLCANAATWQGIDDFNYLYLFSPFPCTVMENVMAHVAESIDRHPRSFRILYTAPLCHDAIEATGRFRRTRDFELSWGSPVALYESKR